VIIIVPMGGVGRRFDEERYRYPKPLINVMGQPMVSRVLSALEPAADDHILLVCSQEVARFPLREIVERQDLPCPVQIQSLDRETRGAAETVSLALAALPAEVQQENVMLVDADVLFEEDVVGLYRHSGGNAILYFEDRGSDPIYSYLQVDETGHVVDVREKERISNLASVGCYCFRSVAVLAEYCARLLQSGDESHGEPYVSDIYRSMLSAGEEEIVALQVQRFACVGTPSQLKLYSLARATSESKRFCFDLEGTLISAPTVAGDYQSARPIRHNIEYLRFLHSQGHHVIIQTSAPTATLEDPENALREALDHFDIPCDELFLAKPAADFYVDDHAINSLLDIEKDTGIYSDYVQPRSFNHVILGGETVRKTAGGPAAQGEVYWYRHIPPVIDDLFPRVDSIDEAGIKMERIDGSTLSSLLVNGCLDRQLLEDMLEAMDRIHQAPAGENGLELDLYANYEAKIEVRCRAYDFSAYDNFEQVLATTLQRHRQYRQRATASAATIHGDPVLTNVMLDRHGGFKFIDMRGQLGDVLTLRGDLSYDYAKVYQSLCGYDVILSGKQPDHEYLRELRESFEVMIRERFGADRVYDLKTLVAGMLLSLIPLHDDEKCPSYYKLACRELGL
jgi:dTDP-glucose pyrophosphorylase